MGNTERIKNCVKCQSCRWYDATQFPEYGGKLAKCVNPKKNFIGAGLIGCYTLASSECYERRTHNGTE